MNQIFLTESLLKILSPEQVLSDEFDLKFYSYDSSFQAKLNRYFPDAVVFPRSTEEVAAVMRLAYEHGIPVTPRGAGTGETCGCLAVEGGLVMDLSTWDTIEEVDTANMQVFVRPGVVHANLNNHLASYGLFFPPDPGSSRMCTVGGMVANNSSGLRAVKYGTTEQYILGLEVVLPNGEVVITGGQKSRAIKNVSGLNLTKLFVGSEGILGIVTKIRLRVWPKPKSRGLAMAVFDNLEQAPQSVLDVYQGGILPSGIEILDDSAIKAINMYKPEINLPNAEAILLFEVDGNPAGVEWEGQQIKEIVSRRAVSVEWATEPNRINSLWQGRSVVATAAARVRPDGSRIFAGEDISVPLNRVTECLRRIKELAAQHGIAVVNYGHIGDGNVHTAPVINMDNQAEVEQVQKLTDAIHRLAVELGGATTGEHGVGAVRSRYAPAEHGRALNVMRMIKSVLDPKGIMNPGKLLPPEGDDSQC
ncbi:D-lactate dehydrogenase (cytochrome) [Desulfofarcimen acetoxidans DSM 771]|uniref:D-lactate dehydrogenase (cytochrome) n=1 Tax=Desulfofarcimen acetoxidans (strain ATCC 49208 / DSM 771 / KCTC 5769 / VKM B-1644 / 5575) TaxID=485916 RepID=C8W3B0_DESAS|nr:FAD-linked oxidase C-terminal domain-containing protein [Desulfofarcimen acetoxidans]ACV61877.1 D-lactate dehydrogenase (cytochrome) [Desulfofarcimen acetoxidans DSM 771]